MLGQGADLLSDQFGVQQTGGLFYNRHELLLRNPDGEDLSEILWEQVTLPLGLSSSTTSPPGAQHLAFGIRIWHDGLLRSVPSGMEQPVAPVAATYSRA